MKQALIHLLKGARGASQFPAVFRLIEAADEEVVVGLYKLIKSLLDEKEMSARNSARRKVLSGRMP